MAVYEVREAIFSSSLKAKSRALFNSSWFSANATLISASAVLHYGNAKQNAFFRCTTRILPFYQNLFGMITRGTNLGHMERDRETDRQTDRQTDRDRDRETKTEKQRERQRQRERDRERKREGGSIL